MAKKPQSKKSKAPERAAKKIALRTPDVSEEARLWAAGRQLVFGVDEAGRGCLAGPVCAAVSCWAPFSSAFGYPAEVRDSKLMTELQREAAFDPVAVGSLTYGVGYATPAEIDRWNIFRATHLAIARALEQALGRLADRDLLRGTSYAHYAFLVDGNQRMVSLARFFVTAPEYTGTFPYLSALYRRELHEVCLVKGDSRAFSIAGASVLAKVSRDRFMATLHEEHPDYEFALHKGYSTPRHLENLRRFGPCSEHRRSFTPVNQAGELFS